MNVNLLSAVCAALTVGHIYLIGVVFTQRRWAPLIGAAALALSYTFWSQAVIAEIYTMGAAAMTAILLLVLIWYHRIDQHNTDHRWLGSAELLGGLSLGIHLTAGLMAAATLATILMLIVFLFSQPYFIEAFTTSGIKI